MPGTPHQPPPRPTGPAPLHDRLSGGDPRTLHNVDEVVKTVLADPERLGELIACVLASHEQIVCLRAGDALKKVCRTQPCLMQPHVWLLLGEMATIHQTSVRWHVAQMLGHVRLTDTQRRRAAGLMDESLDESTDWIVLSCSLETLAALARAGPAVVDDLRGQLRGDVHSGYKSLASRARKLLTEFGPGPTAPTSTHRERQT
jgi:hypothetical protein